MKIENEKINSCNSRLKKMRLSAGMKQVDLAKLTGINVKTICQYEQDPAKINKASVETLAKISDCIGCDLMDIVETKLLDLNKKEK
jgi:DNA-binding XRE family transcriptional regulator